MDKLTNFSNYTTDNNIELHVCKKTKFKTNLIQVYFGQSLKKDTVSKTALLPYVLYRGSRNYPTSRAFKIKLDKLYGANLGVSILKRGENQLIRFSLEIVNEKFLPDKEPLLEKGIELLHDLIFNPLLKEGVFKNDYVKQEKEFLKEEIESLINDKYSYAIKRCYQEMCVDEAFALSKLGNLTTLEGISSQDLYAYYQNMLKNNHLSIFVIGDFDEEKVFSKVNERFSFKHEQPLDYNKTVVKTEVSKLKEVIEAFKVKQGKLSLGFRTGITRKSDLYYALLVYNGILGGFPHSKLFQNVREKASLAYYAFSNLESTKGLMTINSGIQISNYQKAKEIILKQMAEITRGNITDQEFEWTKKGLINQLKSTADSNKGLASYYLLGLINNKVETIETMIKKVEDVSRNEIIDVANQIKLDTIYFLTAKEA